MDSKKVLIMVLNLTLAKKVQARVQARVTAGVCLCCENKSVKRGLCQTHYDQWRYARRTLSPTKQANYDAGLIRNGELLAAYERVEYLEKNRFQKAAKEAS